MEAFGGGAIPHIATTSPRLVAATIQWAERIMWKIDAVFSG
jgi:hypothetical protein